MALARGTKLGPCEILGPIGAGGMGEVYRARDERLSRDVAVKVLPSSLLGDLDRLRRFEQEARAAGQLNHPNILAVYDTGTHKGAPCVVEELIEGETLRQRLSPGPLPPPKELVPQDPAGIETVDFVVMSADARSYAYSYRRMLSTLYLAEGLQ